MSLAVTAGPEAPKKGLLCLHCPARTQRPPAASSLHSTALDKNPWSPGLLCPVLASPSSVSTHPDAVSLLPGPILLCPHVAQET